MRIHIVGPGVVGRATGQGFARHGHEVVYTDRGDDHASVWAGIHMVCTPEDAAAGIVRALAAAAGIIVVRSSVPPGTCGGLEAALRRPVLHNPEFLREATAEQDFLEAKYAVIGSGASVADCDDTRVLSLLYRSLGKEVIECQTVESEMLKLATNAYLHTLISFWTEMQKLCTACGINSHTLATLAVKNDSRVQPYGALRHGPPGAGGKCLPKDREQILSLAREKGLVMPLLEAAKRVNQEAGGP